MPDRPDIDRYERPAMIIDTIVPAIRDANAAAKRIWGLSDDATLPVTIDALMPAVSHIRDQHDLSTAPAPMVFWTCKGAQRLRCRVERLGPQGPALVIFEANTPQSVVPDAAEPPEVGSAPQPVTDASNATSAVPGIDLRTMAHELRSPIAAIMALAEMIEREQFGALGDPRYREYARDIGDSARLSLNIVAASLEQDPADRSPRLINGFAEIDLADLIEKCLRTIELSADEAKIAVSRTGTDHGHLPNLIANAPALTQILLNVLGNAIKFTPQGGTIEVGCTTRDDGALTLTVSDTGVGMTSIDSNVLVSGPASGSADSRTARPARGIGFSLVRRLAAAMDAELEVASARGVGTRVSLTFPAAKVIPVAASQSGTQSY